MRMSVITLTATVVLITNVGRAHSQGLNNEYPVDSIDVLNTMEIHDISAFKFPVKSPTAGKPYYVNYIVDVYEDSKHIESVSFLDTLLAHLPPQMRNSPQLAPRILSTWGIHDSSRLIRIYTERKAEDKIALAFGFDREIQIITLPIDTLKYGAGDSRAMDFAGVQQNKRTPLVVYYMNARDKEVLKCPGDASVEEIAKKYDYAIIVSSELRSSLSDEPTHN